LLVVIWDYNYFSFQINALIPSINIIEEPMEIVTRLKYSDTKYKITEMLAISLTRNYIRKGELRFYGLLRSK
jgi:hypothetical protein